MERQPDYEDDHLRLWKASREEVEAEGDPTVLKFDLSTEEVFESRVYELRPEVLGDLVAELALEHPEIPDEELLFTYMSAAESSSFRMLAKRARSDGSLSWLLVGVIGGRRELMARGEGQPEEVYLDFVASFEADALAGGVVEPPTVIGLEEWREYERRESP